MCDGREEVGEKEQGGKKNLNQGVSCVKSFHKVLQWMSRKRADHIQQSTDRVPFVSGIKTTKYVAAVCGG